MRNLNPSIGLMNGTRFQVKRLLDNVIIATILGGKCKGQDVMIPRIGMAPTDCVYPFQEISVPCPSELFDDREQIAGANLAVCWPLPGAQGMLLTRPALRCHVLSWRQVLGNHLKWRKSSWPKRCCTTVNQYCPCDTVHFEQSSSFFANPVSLGAKHTN